MILWSFFLPQVSTAQQNNIWYFGSGAGISFKGAASGVLPVSYNGNGMKATEGCATICDAAGNLLFYSNGATIYNKTGAVMTNGSGMAGNISAYQSVLILPLPGSDSLYYVFTADAFENTFARGYNYSIVDMTLDNGLGAVTQKNILLHAPGTERLTAARHANGSDIWIITNDYESNIFRNWLLTCTGVQAAPVVSAVGEILDKDRYKNTGCIKVSPDGRLVGQTYFPNIDSNEANSFQVFDFDNSTGVVSNASRISIPGSYYNTCEFSPNSKLLYVTNSRKAEINQFDVSVNNAAAITVSRYAIPAVANFYGIQTGPDNKIYLNRSAAKLSIINSPDTKGAGCNFIPDKIDLNGKDGQSGLPSCLNDLFRVSNLDFTYKIEDSCLGQVTFSAETIIGGTVQWFWDFGDGATSALQNPVHTFPSPDKEYPVVLKVNAPSACGYFEKGRSVIPGGIVAHAAFSYKASCDSPLARFSNLSAISDSSLVSYVWNFNDGSFSFLTNPVHVFPQAKAYAVQLKLITPQACLNDSARVTVDVSKFVISAPPDQTIEEGKSVVLNATGAATGVRWQPTDWLSNANISNPVATPFHDIVYTVSATNGAGCVASDSVSIKVIEINDIYIPTAFTPNGDGLNDFIRPYFGSKYQLIFFRIYNRAGKKLFETSLQGRGWDGNLASKPQDMDTYVWVIEVKDRNNKSLVRKGNFALIR